MKLYVIRHGESESNREKLWTGWANPPLTERGKEEARLAGKLISGISFDRIFSSDLERAVQTAKCAIDGCVPEELEVLREINVGTLEGKPLSVLNEEERTETAINGYESNFAVKMLRFLHMQACSAVF